MSDLLRRKSTLAKYAGITAAGTAGILLAGMTGLAAYLSSRISQPRRSRRPPHYTFTPWEFQIPYREFTIPVTGGEISAWFLPQERSDAPCIVGLSGFASHKAELLGIASNLYRDGFAVLLIDFRGTGRSQGNVVTMGHNETEDARSAIDWLARELPEAPIGVIGFSMGGSVALMLSATDHRISAVVSDSAFATQRKILGHHIRRKTRLWPEPVLQLAAPMLRRRHGKSYDEFAPATIADQISPRPLLLIHAQNDQIVPFGHALEIWDHARDPKLNWFPDEVGHCGAYFADRVEYCRRVSAFFQDALNQPVSSRDTLDPASN
jgi:uncharacterized protein